MRSDKTVEQLIFYGILIAIILIIIIGVSIEARNDKKRRAMMDKDHFILRHSKITVAFFIFGAFFMFGLILFMVLFPNDTAHWWIAVSFGIVGLVSLLLAFTFMKWRMEVKDKTITITSLFKGTKTYKIEDVATVMKIHQGLLIHFEDGEKTEVSRVLGIDLLITLFQEAGKFDYSQQQENLIKFGTRN